MPDSAPHPAATAARPLERSALWQLTHARIVGFLREPEAMFWVFAFPILLALALGIAFRNQTQPKSAVGVIEGTLEAASLAHALSASPDLTVTVLDSTRAETALGRGKIAVLVRPRGGGSPEIEYDPDRPETRLARLTVRDALERAAGRTDRLTLAERTTSRAGSRYIDFLIPGLIGLNLMGTGMWGVGFPVATARQQKLLKRLVATPMKKSDYLLALMFARMVWLVLEVGALLAFGAFAFGVIVRGSWLGVILVNLIAALAFSAIGLLVASRARTIEAVSGLMNFVMMPMWLLSGSFFTSERFPAWMQPIVQALPLTATNNALRALMNEGASLAGVFVPLAIISAWGLVAFAAALRWFRWE